MRLTAIKMAGFKSFVDPTTLLVPTNLTGVVGPNGCGKSNIIDAIRWVMGEGSAKVLRGESMADVIFNGSSGRKPVGTATVELIFDNSDGRIGGEYAQYNEISVKRQVSRDGQSNYYLNSARCRKKDITDIFLGTGLGPRSYSIIEQGMISQIVEARPEELRGHLEEAAGISKYRDRRRDTESRISRTRDNLDRLADLRDEVGKHIDRLQRQARAAERWKKFKQESRDLESRLLAVGWRELTAQAEVKASELKNVETSMESKVADQRAAESALEELREQQAQATEGFNGIQGAYYEIGGEIARLEQSIQHEREMQGRRKQEFEETKSGLEDLEKHIVLDRSQVEELSQALAELEPLLSSAQQTQTQSGTEMESKSLAADKWQENFDSHRQESVEVSGRTELERARIEHLDQRIAQSRERLDVLASESGGAADTALQKELKKAVQSSEESAKALLQGQKSLEKLRETIQQGRDGIGQKQKELSEQQRLQASLKGRLSSLQTLQESSLEKDRSSSEWRDQQGLDNTETLLETIQVEEQWRQAVEQVLKPWLNSLLAAGEKINLDSFTTGALSLVNPASGNLRPRAGTLAMFCKAPDAIVAILNQVYTASSTDDAYARRKSLKATESVVTAAAEWFGSDWTRLDRGSDGSVLDREQEIRKVENELTDLDNNIGALQSQLSKLQSSTQENEALRRQAQADTNELYRSQTQDSGQVDRLQLKITELGEREKRDRDELSKVQTRMDDDSAALKQARSGLEVLINKMAEIQTTREALDTQRKEVLSARDQARAKLHQARDAQHEVALKVGSRRASLDSLSQSLSRMDGQLGQLQQRFVQLSEQVAKDEKPDESQSIEMDKLLQQRVKTEKELTQSRTVIQALENDYRQADSKRQKALAEAEEIRQELEAQRLSLQELQIKARSLAERLSEQEQNAEELASALDESIDVAAMQAELDKLESKILRLEPVNLAAIAEFDEESERKNYLDAQHEDLVSALTTLETAIAKIDRQTRSKFKETYELVNKGVQELFPRLFGGGHAYLELTGDDLLTTGVTIMARPPGKRISSIHLLSGGEKALTAVALVFAIFQLNPAPFCLLDEVDAPLDDANVGRFSALVRDMSETVQFLFVTHNKGTMEMAYQLCGVTMREAGVSRLVTVDLEEAAAYVQQG